jgi:hypothetical protein
MSWMAVVEQEPEGFRGIPNVEGNAVRLSDQGRKMYLCKDPQTFVQLARGSRVTPFLVSDWQHGPRKA